MLLSALSAKAAVLTIESDISDADIRMTSGGMITTTTNTVLSIGGSNGTTGSNMAAVVVFQLPDIGNETLVDANLALEVAQLPVAPGGTNSWPKGLDIYGVRYAANALVVTNDYGFGPAPGNETLIQDNFVSFTNGMKIFPAVVYHTDNTGDANLVNWIRTQYTNGAVAGNYVYLRINLDTPTAIPTAISSGDSIDKIKPVLTLVTAGPCNLSVTNASPAVFVQKPFVTTNLPLQISNSGNAASNALSSVTVNPAYSSWLSVSSNYKTNSVILPASSVTNYFTAIIASNAPVGVYSNAFDVSAQGTGSDLSTNTVNSTLPLEIVTTVFASLSKTNFTSGIGGSDSATLTVSNTAPFALAYQLSSVASWLSPTGTLSLAANSSTSIAVTASAGALSAGLYTNELAVAPLNNSSAAIQIPVSFRIGEKVNMTGYQVVEYTNIFTGVTNSQFEAGETVQITVTNKSTGTGTITNTVYSTLSADPAYFTITPASGDTYPPPFVEGQTTTTVYTVAINSNTPQTNHLFTVTNRTGNLFWVDSFSIPVIRKALPGISTNGLTITVPLGGTASASITLTNRGNASATFHLTNSNVWPTVYRTSQLSASLEPIFDGSDTNIPFPSVNSAMIALGFNFPFYGTTYTNFSISRYGAIGLGTTAGSPSVPPALPNGTAPIIAPFWSSTLLSTNSIRFQRMNDKLVVAWGRNTGNEFQAWLWTNGVIQYVYEDASWNNAAIGIQNSTRFTELNYPGAGAWSWVLTPLMESWVTPSSGSGTVNPLNGQTISFIADASSEGVAAGTANYTFTVKWDDGSSTNLNVKVIVVAATYGMTVSTNNMIFSGDAGFITKTNVLLVNTGSVDLAYTITDTGARTVGYTWSRPEFSWVNATWDVFTADFFLMDPAAADEGYSRLIPIGFDFPYYGTVYTNFCIAINGAISLGEVNPVQRYEQYDQYNTAFTAFYGSYYFVNYLNTVTNVPPTQSGRVYLNNVHPLPRHLIAPYWDDLVWDDNTSIKYKSNGNDECVVTWENMKQKIGGENQTFQVILRKNGEILFQYASVSNSTSWVQAEIGLRDTPDPATLASTNKAILAYTGGSYDSPGTIQYVTNSLITTNGYIYDSPILVTNNVVLTNYSAVVTGEAIRFSPAVPTNGLYYPGIISIDPRHGTLPAGSNQTIKITGDARSLTYVSSNGVPVTVSNVFNVVYPIATGSASKLVTVKFIASNSVESAYSAADSDNDGMSDRLEMLAGTDENDANSVFGLNVVQGNGFRTLSWPAANDNLSHTYTIQYTTDLTSEWQTIYQADNCDSYTDTDEIRAALPVIYYRVTVQ